MPWGAGLVGTSGGAAAHDSQTGCCRSTVPPRRGRIHRLYLRKLPSLRRFAANFANNSGIPGYGAVLSCMWAPYTVSNSASVFLQRFWVALILGAEPLHQFGDAVTDEVFTLCSVHVPASRGLCTRGWRNQRGRRWYSARCSVQVKQYGFKHFVHLKILIFFLIIVAFAKNSKANLSNLPSTPEIPCKILENLCHFRHFMV